MALFSPIQSCTPTTFSTLALFGGEVLSIDTKFVTNYSFTVPAGWLFSQPSVDVQNASFCKVTVRYTHPGQNDAITAEIWMPPEAWNGRLQAIGGGGWVAGRYVLAYAGMAGAIYDGYATATTDAGLQDAQSPAPWGLVSPGNLNLVAFDNFGQTSLNDLAVIAKQVVHGYYGIEPLYSYWNGCSNGGRQAGILAQQYFDAYDGILAAAPGLSWAELAMTSIWPAFYMDLTKQYPSECEMQQLTSLAIEACDALDGVKDGLISDPEQCKQHFHPADHLGAEFTCEGTGLASSISSAAVDIANALFHGPTYSNADFMWYGYEIGTDLATLAASECTTEGDCVPTERASLQFWWQLFVLKDLSANVTTLTLTHEQYDRLYLTLKKELAPVSATETRLFEFQRAGGKMLTYHGLADGAITPQSTLSYYEEVSRVIDDAAGFYRYYRVPGLQHCFGGSGGQPIHMFDQLRAWVENGTAPVGSPVTIQLPNNATMKQLLCPYPQKAHYRATCANRTTVECWQCK
ncbi:Tannase/feruloyl esterase [Aspergillus similis]